MQNVAGRLEAVGSAVAWGSVIAGALVAAGVSLILLSLGSGLGFASMSPWADRGMSAGAITVAAAIWLIVTQWIASALGGYIAGRTRIRWAATHHHEIFFRDTAQGLITWALSTVVVTLWVASAASAMLGGARAVSQAAVPAGRAAIAADASRVGPGSQDYGIDRLFRVAEPGVASRDLQPAHGAEQMAQDRAEVAHMLANFAVDGTFPDSDRQYLAGLVSARTGLPAPAAQKRVDELVADAVEARSKLQAAADSARKAAAQSAIYLALALLIGAFVASVSAALGGRLRDQQT